MATIGPDAQYRLARSLLSYDDAANLVEVVADNLEPAADVAALTDNSGGAAADKTIAVVTAPTAQTDSSGGTASATLAAQTLPTALTDNGGGTGDGTVEAQSAFAASVAWDGATVFPSAADEALLTSIALAARNNIRELTVSQAANLAQLTVLKAVTASYAARQAENRAAIVALTNAVTELATQVNLIRTNNRTAGLML